jgi:preprotein translocase subunit SecE
MAQANIETVSSPLDRIKVAVALLMVVAGIAGFYLLADYPTVVRVVAVLAGLLAGAGVAYTSEPGRRFFAFAEDSYKETRKVVWPSQKETFQTTAVVFGFVAVMALFLWLTDKTLEVVLYDWILGWRR